MYTITIHNIYKIHVYIYIYIYIYIIIYCVAEPPGLKMEFYKSKDSKDIVTLYCTNKALGINFDNKLPLVMKEPKADTWAKGAGVQTGYVSDASNSAYLKFM